MKNETISIICPLCGETCESDIEIDVGMRLQCPFCDGHFNYGVSSADDTTDTEVFQDGELGGTVADRHATPSPRKINRIISRVVKHKAVLAASLLVALATTVFCCVVCSRGKSIATNAVQTANISAEPSRLPEEKSKDKTLPEKSQGEVWYEIGLSYLTGDTYTEKDPRKGAEIIERAAEIGYAPAQNKIAVCYAHGLGVPKDSDEAIKWFRKAAEQGCAEAQRNLAFRYEFGIGIQKNLAEAVKWFRKAAEQGDTMSQNEVGLCYLRGEGVVQDYDEAIKWFRKASEKGNALAQGNLGLCLKNDWGDSGLSLQERRKEAVKLFWKSANQGCDAAQFELGECYREGVLVGRDLEEAEKWYVMSAKQGYVKAQSALGFLYIRGFGRKAGEKLRYEDAVMWLRKAADQGDHAAMGKLDELGLEY